MLNYLYFLLFFVFYAVTSFSGSSIAEELNESLIWIVKSQKPDHDVSISDLKSSWNDDTLDLEFELELKKEGTLERYEVRGSIKDNNVFNKDLEAFFLGEWEGENDSMQFIEGYISQSDSSSQIDCAKVELTLTKYS